jgi:hypothetical protein
MNDLEFRHGPVLRPLPGAYPQPLPDGLGDRSGLDGGGRLPDLARETGQASLALHHRFAQTPAFRVAPSLASECDDHEGDHAGSRPSRPSVWSSAGASEATGIAGPKAWPRAAWS